MQSIFLLLSLHFSINQTISNQLISERENEIDTESKFRLIKYLQFSDTSICKEPFVKLTCLKSASKINQISTLKKCRN